MIQYLAYVSRATRPFDDDELVNLLRKSRERNVLADLTGMLLYSDSTFVQVLEGNPDKVSALYQKIEKDPRHRDVIILGKGELERRNFPTWAMGFDCMRWMLGKPQFGVVDFMKETSRYRLPNSDHFCVQLLREFRNAEVKRMRLLAAEDFS